MQIGDKCFLKGEFVSVFLVSDINDDEAWLINEVSGTPLGWVSIDQCHFGEDFGEELRASYGDLLI